MTGDIQQAKRALKLANEKRVQASAVKRAIRSGRLSIGEALDMPEAGSIKLGVLILSQYKVGRMRQMALLKKANISESRRVDCLTQHEKKRIRELTND